MGRITLLSSVGFAGEATPNRGKPRVSGTFSGARFWPIERSCKPTSISRYLRISSRDIALRDLRAELDSAAGLGGALQALSGAGSGGNLEENSRWTPGTRRTWWACVDAEATGRAGRNCDGRAGEVDSETWPSRTRAGSRTPLLSPPPEAKRG